ncbi:hypothetical protein DVH07_05090 [Hafnia paralvei]|uniref:hypothetical protein n=1 Tax=Hafnia paralvei TaxID=546367 RepID=UPI000DF45A61|nr:hypothetical protein [Hafnia paralvei]RDA69984.1 hypothetical protein DU449_05090 [Hafnia paralvei]RDA70812.1 hypothetical protein DVH09_05475 [Hafnia paralvei]RDA71577.1 hypothetical protein DVH08_05415 [Hafnia paralvei]RDA80247.1 hypothetical protein DVH10_04940 [Hafnia paralvei]RDA80595.1 hypothetical protein DVH07_05090 [Hafnia paralvei]
MEEEQLIIFMQKNGFSKKQIDSLKKISKNHSTTLFDTVFELGRRFSRSLILHVFLFIIIIYTYLHDRQQDYYTSKYIFLYIGSLCIVYFIIHLFAPLIQGYKARKVINKIKQKKP